MIVVIRRIFVADAVIGKNLLKSTCSTTQKGTSYGRAGDCGGGDRSCRDQRSDAWNRESSDAQQRADACTCRDLANKFLRIVSVTVSSGCLAIMLRNNRNRAIVDASAAKCGDGAFCFSMAVENGGNQVRGHKLSIWGASV